MMVPGQVWVVGRLEVQPVVEHGCCMVLVATGHHGPVRERREVRVVGAAAERVAGWREGTVVEIEARIMGSRRTLVAHRISAVRS